MKKRILIITNRFYPQLGGAEINIFHQAKELTKTYDVDVITHLRDHQTKKEVVDGIQIIRLKDWFSSSFPNHNPITFCPSIFFRILTHRYHLIHCFPALNHNNLLALFASKIKRIPIFLSNFDLFDTIPIYTNIPMILMGFINSSLDFNNAHF